MKAILAGFMISLGAYVYLKVGEVIGTFLFSIGLLTILNFGFNLFTGKVGLLSKREISWRELAEIWIGNFFGAFAFSFLLDLLPVDQGIVEKAFAATVSHGVLADFVLGILCGVLMFIAVTSWSVETPLYAVLPVMVFLMAGFSHCVAQMFYCNLCKGNWEVLLPVTLGNLVGGNLINFLLDYH